jgi:TonB family protein
MTDNKPLSHQLPASGVHLSQEQLFAFLSGQVSPSDKQTLEDHLQTCTLCTEALEGFSLTNSAAAQASLLELNHLIRKRTARRKKNTLLTDVKTWGIATAIIFLLVVSAAIVWNTLQHQPAPSAKGIGSGVDAAQPIRGADYLNQYLEQEQANMAVQFRKQNPKKGQVVLTFKVNPDGRLTDFIIIKSLGAPYDSLAQTWLQKGPAWQAARQQGKQVAQKATWSITFK